MARAKSATAGVRVLRAHGAQVSKPVAMAKTTSPTKATARRGARTPAARSQAGRDALLRALESQELKATHEFTIVPTRPAPGWRPGRGAAVCHRGPSRISPWTLLPRKMQSSSCEQGTASTTWHYPPALADRGATRQAGVRRDERNVCLQVTIPIASR